VSKPDNVGAAASRGARAIFLCAVCWSTSGLFIKLLDWHPMVIAGLRSFVAALFLLVLKIIRGRAAQERFQKSDFSVFRIPSFWLAAAAYSTTMLSFVVANKLTASANVILLQYGAPVWAALLGWALLGEKPHMSHWLALVLVVAGLLVFFRDSLVPHPELPFAFIGDVISLISGMLFGANAVFMRMGNRAIKEQLAKSDGGSTPDIQADSMLAAHAFAALVSIPFLFIYTPVLRAPSVAAILFMGIVQLGVASALFAHGIKHVRAIEAMLISMTETVLNPIWVLVFTGEAPSLSAIVGGLMIIAAVFVPFIKFPQASPQQRQETPPS
jgi:drug/metabolite transporter (DMT)-like permease